MQIRSKRIKKRLKILKAKRNNSKRISYKVIRDFHTNLLTSIIILAGIATLYIPFDSIIAIYNTFDSTATDVLRGADDHLKI